MINSPFRTAVSSAFDDMTEDQEESSSRMLVAPNPGGLSAFLIGCLDSSFGDQSPKASLFSAEAIMQVFDAKGWDMQMSFVKKDLFVLLDALMEVDPEIGVSDTVPAQSAELQTLARAKDTKKSAGMQPGPKCSNNMSKYHSSTIEEDPSKKDNPHEAKASTAEFVDEDVVADIQHRWATGIFPVLRPKHLEDPKARKNAEDLLKLTVPHNQIKLQSFIVSRMQEFLQISRDNAANPLSGRHVG